VKLLRGVLLRLLPRRLGAAALADLDRELAERQAQRQAQGRSRGAGVLLWYAWEGTKLAAHLRMADAVAAVQSETALVIAGLGGTVAIGMGLATFAAYLEVYPWSPPQEGVLVVALEASASDSTVPATMDDVLTWRRQMSSVVEISAFRDAEGDLIDDHTVAGERVAEMTASGFRVAGVRPLRGRYLMQADEVAGAEPVVVIGYDVWQRRFGRDPAVVGREIRLGEAVHRVVGVMPVGFGFPENHEYWIPLRRAPSGVAHADDSAVFVFARVAPGASLDAVHAELSLVGRRMAAAVPDAPRRLRAHVLPYAEPPTDAPLAPWERVIVQFMIGLEQIWR
jgi:hypothetical protein